MNSKCKICLRNLKCLLFLLRTPDQCAERCQITSPVEPERLDLFLAPAEFLQPQSATDTSARGRHLLRPARLDLLHARSASVAIAFAIGVRDSAPTDWILAGDRRSVPAMKEPKKNPLMVKERCTQSASIHQSCSHEKGRNDLGGKKSQKK